MAETYVDVAVNRLVAAAAVREARDLACDGEVSSAFGSYVFADFSKNTLLYERQGCEGDSTLTRIETYL